MATQLRVGSEAQPPPQVQKPGGTEPSPTGSTVGKQGCPLHMHLPPAQVAPSGQRVPQLPQLRMSDCRLTQPSEPQHDWPRLHLSPLRRAAAAAAEADGADRANGVAVAAVARIARHVLAHRAAAFSAALIGMRRADALADDARAHAHVDAARADSHAGQQHDRHKEARHSTTLAPCPVAVNARDVIAIVARAARGW